jgi:hypothetical protein
VKGDEQLLAMATDVLNLEDVAPKDPLLTDGDYELIVTALAGIAAECSRIGHMSADTTIREAFHQSASAYRQLKTKIENRS